MASSTDRIRKEIVVRASRARVWRALADSTEFGTWFGMKFDGPFVTGQEVGGTIVPTKVDAEVASQQKPYEGFAFRIAIETMLVEHEFSFRWHPFAIEKGVDYASEPMTRVVFSLSDVPEGVLVVVTESGFDKIPAERRAKAFAANEGGWGMALGLLEKCLAQTT